MAVVTPATGARYFGKGFGDQHAHPSFGYLFDATVEWQPSINGTPGAVATGAWRPAVPADFAANISVSGLNLSVGAVALTGTSVVTLTGNTPVSIVNTSPISFSGVVLNTDTGIRAVNVTNTAPLAISGVVLTVVTGSVSSSTDLSPVVLAVASGNRFLSGISGELAAPLTVSVNNTAPLPFSGITQSNITNSAPIPVSGVVVASVTTVDTGVRAVNVTNSILAISGNVTTTTTIGNLAVTGFSSTIAPLAVSGVFNATTDNTTVVLAVSSGNAYLAFISGRELVNGVLLSGISGQLASNLTDPAAVTGSVGITNTAPIPISGVVQATVTVGNTAVTGGSIGVTGGNINVTNALFATSGTFIAPNLLAAIVSGNNYGLVSNVLLSGVSGALTTNLTAPAYVTGTVGISNPVLAVSGIVTTTAPAIQAISGIVTATSTISNAVLATSGTNIDTITGFNTGIVVSIQPVTKTAVSNSTPSGASPWTSMTQMVTGSFAANPNRVMFFVQNTHTGLATYIALNGTAASTGNFNIILNPSMAVGYGGASYSDDHWRGQIQISGGGYISWEL